MSQTVPNLDDYIHQFRHTANSAGSISQLGTFLAIQTAIQLGSQVLGFVGGKFFDVERLPVKVNYVDRWPAFREKVQNFASNFWGRRAEGTAVGTAVSSALFAGYLLPDIIPNSVSNYWDAAKKSTASFINLFSSIRWQSDDWLIGPIAFAAVPMIAGGLTTLSAGAYDFIYKYFDHDRVLDIKPVFGKELQSELDDLVAMISSLKKENGFFQNLLLYGPPGTGKTMISKWIAKNSNMNYILMSGNDLVKSMTEDKGGAALQKLIDHAHSCSSPTVIFIDEAESFCTDRNKTKNKDLILLMNAFLEKTSQSSSKIMYILATNRPQDLDSAVLSRMDYKLFVNFPQIEERKNIIKISMNILFPKDDDRKLFTEEIINFIAEKTEGFSGRDLFKLLNRIKGKPIDKSNIDVAIQRFVQQVRQIEAQKLPVPNHLENS